jgi:predicted DNA-binding WGR domain protein
MTSFQDFLHGRLEAGGFTTEDALACFLPLVRLTGAAHQAGLVAPLAGINDLHVEGGHIWFEESRRQPPSVNAGAVARLEKPAATAVEIISEFRLTTNVDQGQETITSAQIGKRGEEMTRPLYLPGYVSWEHEIGHHDPLTDTFSLGMILASLVCGLDLNDPEHLARLVRHRPNLFELSPALHPVLAKAVGRMTELVRSRRPQDLAGLLHALENYRDQDIDFDLELARIPEWKSADPKGKRGLILTRLQQRLFEISRRNRLLHFRPTMQTVNLTLASVPLSFDIGSIRPDQILTWNDPLQQAVVSGKPLSLNKHLRFEEAVYLPSQLDQIRNEANRDQAEYGFAQLRLVLCFLRWSNLKETPPERFDSPLVLLPVRLTRCKGVRDVYTLEAQSTEAEINPILRYYLKQLYAIELPETLDLASTVLESLHELLAARVQASEPAVTVEKIDRPRIQLIQARAQRRLDQYRRRVRLSGRGVRSFLDIDYSYDLENFHPLGLRLFQTHIRAPATQLSTIVTDKPRPRRFMVPEPEVPATEKDRLLYSLAEDEANPYRWEFDLCNVTLGNFRYRKMSLVRDYDALLANGSWPAGLEALFSLEPRPAQSTGVRPPALADSHPIVPWDPTQASAIAFARTGKSYIIQGPPGTGKSQTITNLIADYVVQGKRVLFVCAKRAAIDVVYHRLHQAGLEQLCCLIHDSQADKKEFIAELKQSYERLLENQGAKEAPAADARRHVLSAMSKELEALQRFDSAMRGEPPRVGMPLRRLLHRALELHENDAADPPPGGNALPPYALWHEHGECIGRLAGLLQDLQGNDVLAQHPLRRLSVRLARQERPVEHVRQCLEAAESLLNGLSRDLPALPSGEQGSLATIGHLVEHAVAIRFLAERSQLALLQPDSEPARALAELRRQYEDASRKLERAESATKGWRRKLPADETRTALDQARSFEGRMLAFLQPAWWRLRGVLRRCYDFRAHAVKPSWKQVLERLDHEHECRQALNDFEDRARAQLGYTDTLLEFADKIAAIRDGMPKRVAAVAALHARVLAAPDGADTVLRLAALQPAFQQLEIELEKFLDDGRELDLEQLQDELSLIEESLDDLPDFVPCLAELALLPESVARMLRRLDLPTSRLEAVVARESLNETFQADRAVARFTAQSHARHARRLEKTHDEFHGANAAVVRDTVRRRFLEHVRLAALPHAQLTAAQKEWKGCYNRGRRELEHEFGKTMRYKSIRDLAAGDSGLVIQDLKPVWLMSPLSVSDTLPFDTDHFDVVIFDEASQVPLEEAVPALFRAAQTIVVGDEMQLPPTSFFAARQPEDEETLTIDDEGEVVEYELSGNSFLNHAARNLPATLLGWHYRSRSESLISFSNRAFYEGRLLSVPEVAVPICASDPDGDPRDAHVSTGAQAGADPVAWLLDRPVSFHFMEYGVYLQRRNTVEAEYIAHLTRELLARDSGLSIGIIAFSEAQQGEIEEALRGLASADRDFRDRLEAEREREVDGQHVGLLVKNLENIQGDERDIVILSVCYGRGPNGKMLMNFGPINQTGGERRLNVAFSRARQHMVLVTSIRQPDITNDYNDGARCLKNYLRYAEAVSVGDSGAVRRALWDLSHREDRSEAGVPADIVVTQIADALRERSYLVDVDVGQSSFHCDLAVRRAGERAYRLGILVDTDAYYLNADLLERDVLKPKLLRDFGWKVALVLTKDWYENRQDVLSRLERLAAGEEDVASGEPEAAALTPDAAVSTIDTQPGENAPVSAPAADDAVAKPAPGGSPWTRYFEYVADTSSKFWEITVAGSRHTVRFGRIGASGQSKSKQFSDPSTAQRDALRLIQEKLAKGYVERETR